jgi:hypothetical protein
MFLKVCSNMDEWVVCTLGFMFAYTLAGGKRLPGLTYKVDAEKYNKI